MRCVYLLLGVEYSLYFHHNPSPNTATAARNMLKRKQHDRGSVALPWCLCHGVSTRIHATASPRTKYQTVLLNQLGTQLFFAVNYHRRPQSTYPRPTPAVQLHLPHLTRIRETSKNLPWQVTQTTSRCSRHMVLIPVYLVSKRFRTSNSRPPSPLPYCCEVFSPRKRPDRSYRPNRYTEADTVGLKMRIGLIEHISDVRGWAGEGGRSTHPL